MALMEHSSTVLPFSFLSSKPLHVQNRSYFHVKLSDASRLCLERLVKKLKSQTSSGKNVAVGEVRIDVDHEHGSLLFMDKVGDEQEFKFSICDIDSSDVLNGKVQVLRQYQDRQNPPGAVEYLSEITHRMKILTTDKDSVEFTKRIAFNETEDSKKPVEKGVKEKVIPGSRHGASKSAQKILQKISGSSVASVKAKPDRPLTPINSSGVQPNPISSKPLRQRLIQLLALKPTKSVDVLARLSKEGLQDADKAIFQITLDEIAQPRRVPSPTQDKGSTEYELRAQIWCEVRSDWPHYTKWDVELVKKNIAAKILQSSVSTGSKSSSSAGSTTGNVDDFEMGIGRKDDTGRTRVVPPRRQQAPLKQETTKESTIKPLTTAVDSPVGDIPDILDLIEADQEASRRRFAQKRKQVDDVGQDGSTNDASNKKLVKIPENCDSSASVESVNKSSDLKVVNGKTSASNNVEVSNVPVEVVDFSVEFPTITDEEERKRYKEIFNAEYPIYTKAYERLTKVFSEILNLGTRLESIPDNSVEYQDLEQEIIEKYRKYESDKALTDCKLEHDKLRSKLSILKQRIKQYDAR